jgi:hypothetical protein
MVRKHTLTSATCDHCGKEITATGQEVYEIYTSIWVSQIGDDIEKHAENETPPIQQIDSDLCLDCYRNLEQVLQEGGGAGGSGKKKK